MKAFSIHKALLIKILIVIFSLIIVFHLLVLMRIIPQTMVWGGRVKTVSEMQKMESISLVVNLLILSFYFIELGWISMQLAVKFSRTIYLLLSVLFLMNTLGNLLSKSQIEQIIFTPLTFILSILNLCLFLKNKSEN